MDSHHNIPLLGGSVGIVLYDMERHLAEEIVDATYKEGLRMQRIFNFYDPKSELSMLNKRRRIQASKELRDVLRMALEYCALTGGKYDITLGKQFLQRKAGKDVTSVACSYKDVYVEGNIVELAHPDAMVDLGSIAKGYIADRLLAYIQHMGAQSAFIDARGDICIAGDRLEVIQVQHPRSEARIRPFVLENMAVATSGDYKQYVKEFAQSHIIGVTDLASVTIIAPTLAEADAIATAAFVSGSEGARTLMCGTPHAKALLITTSGKEIALNGFENLELDRQIIRSKQRIAHPLTKMLSLEIEE